MVTPRVRRAAATGIAHEARTAIHDVSSQVLTLPGGRRLGYIELGPATGAPVFYCHGFPASRLEARLVEAASLRRGVRMIAADRPGYGLSDFRPGRRIGDWPADVMALADALHLGRFSVLGVSGGAPYAVACAALLPERVSAAGIVGGLGSLDWEEDLTAFNAFARFSFVLARRAPALSQAFNRALAPLLRNRPRRTLKLLASKLPPPDADVLSDPYVFAAIAASFREAFRQGGRGAALDLILYARPWDIALESIRVPFHVWHAEQDTTVPLSMGKRLAATIPGCRARYYADEGHFSLPVRRMEEMLAALVGERDGQCVVSDEIS